MVPARAGARHIKALLSRAPRRDGDTGPAPGAEPRPLRVDLEEASGTLAAADAHGHHTPAGAPALPLLQDVAGAARAGHAEGVTHGDRPTVHVVAVIVDAEAIPGVEALAGEGLVQLPQ